MSDHQLLPGDSRVLWSGTIPVSVVLRGENCSLSFGNEEPGKAPDSEFKINPEAPESNTASPTGAAEPSALPCAQPPINPDRQHPHSVTLLSGVYSSSSPWGGSDLSVLVQRVPDL